MFSYIVYYRITVNERRIQLKNFIAENHSLRLMQTLSVLDVCLLEVS